MTDAKFKAFVDKLDNRPKRKNVPGPLKFFERKGGEYHQVHCKDAHFVATEYFKTSDVVKMNGDGDVKVPTVNVNHKKMARITRDAVLNAYRDVEIYHKENGEWKLKKKATPGNFQGFEDILFPGGVVEGSSTTLACRIKCAKEGHIVIGIALADTTAREFKVAELIEHETLWNLESAVLQHGVKECFIEIDSNAKELVGHTALAVLERCKIQYKECKAGFFKTENIRQDLARLIGNVTPHLELLDKQLAMGSLSCLILQLDLLKEESTNLFSLSELNLSQFVRLDAAAIEALNIKPQATDTDKNMSLYGLLNKCRTAMGSRLLKRWLLQPLRDINSIEKRLDMVEAFADSQDIRATLQEQDLRGIPDLDRIVKLLKRGKATLKDLYQLWIFACKLPLISKHLKEYEGEHEEIMKETFTDPIEELVEGLGQYVALVEKLLDFNAIENDRAYRINPDFDTVLGEYKSTLQKLSDRMEKLRSNCADDLGLQYSKVKLLQLTTKRWHFRMTRKDEKNLRKKSSKYSILETRKDGVKFTTRELSEASKTFVETEKSYTHQQQRIVDKGMEVAATYTPVIERASEIMARLDAFIAFAHVSVNAPEPYCRPKILPSSSGIIKMKACRHPCVETQDFVDFIPNDVEMTRDKSNCQVITGPNMGGKSTYIRQVGVSVLLAQVGCFVPCSEATISVVDSILARVGAGDSQLKGVSTFMREMLEAAAILRTATENSLIIVDELGRGTSTYDGFGLAWAIAEHLASEARAFTLFATHFHELTRLAVKVSSVVNRHVTAITDNNSITMLYQLNDGPCDRSFGIHVAELAKFPAEVVQQAKRKAEELEDFGGAAEEILSGDCKTVGVVSSPKVGSKRQRVEKGDANMEPAIKNFLNSFAKIPLSTPDSEMLDKVGELRKVLEEKVGRKNLETAFLAAK